ncbi:hypothetical protein JQ581_22225 [Bradyrhizobium liaoningense]|uniref:hypothetical protein n=1 Tax=Bradyrhizobium liaoningense TaxID=43992 RepID=UPI001BAC3538|nr:hypothetical protein [Bradyrhizobium liaoningense]MBR0739654.1 hypothetical protein [Bradyrhizobium liaoningense]
MSGDFGDYQRPVVSNRTVLQKKPPPFRGWWMVYAALLMCVLAAVWMRRTVPAESAAPVTADVGDNHTKLRERGAAMLAAAQKAKLEAAPRRPEPEMMVPRQEGAPDQGSNTVAASTAQRGTGSDTIASPPAPQTLTPAPALPSPEVQQEKSEQETIVRQPENQFQAQAPASNAVTPPTEDQAPRADTAATLSDPQRSKPETAAAPLDTQISKPEVDIATRKQLDAQKPNATASPSNTQSPRSKGRGKDRDKDGDNDADKVVAVPQLVLPDDVAQKVGHKIWLNETDGNRDAITSWNAGEEFASLGIGHFLWFPAGKPAPFEESFPPLLEFLRQQNAHLPSWIDKVPIPPCPWTSRADFKKNFNSPQMKELRQFLLDTVAGQAQYLVVRANGAMEKILRTAADSAERAHIITQFSRIVQASKDLYPLIDYVEFKGEGINPEETAVDKQTGTRQGWGLKQVLLKMNGTAIEPKAVLAEYADAAQSVLQQRVRNIPANHMWESGWLRRVDTYRRPLIEVASNPKPAQGKPSRAKSRKRK